MAQDGPKTDGPKTDGPTWYLETPQGLEGPYTLDALRACALDGTARLADRVMNAENNSWSTVSDLFADLDAELNKAGKNFVPPPRPASHNALAPGADYLSRISAKNSENPSTPLKIKPTTKKPTVMERTREILRRGFGTSNNNAPAGTSSTLRFVMSSAAALTLMTLGTYGLMKLKEESTARSPAAGTSPAATTGTEATPLGSAVQTAVAPPVAAPPRTAPAEMPSALGNTIGSGENAVHRNLGAAMQTPTAEEQERAQVQAQMQAPAPANEAQHYDPATFDQVNTAVTPPSINDGAGAGFFPPPQGAAVAAPTDAIAPVPNPQNLLPPGFQQEAGAESPNRDIANDPNAVAYPQGYPSPPSDATASPEVQPGEYQQTPNVDGTAY